MKFKRTERIGAIVKILSDNPNKIFTLSHFTNQFNAAKSTISEDLLVVKNVFEKLEFTEENDWRIVYNEETGKMLFVKMVDGVKEKENIF